MTKKEPLILLTNDDSIESPGLWAAAEALAKLGYVEVVAPREQQTSMGRSYPQQHDARVHPQTLKIHGQDWTVYGVGGSPAQAVVYGMLEHNKEIDLVVSGINFGENLGASITASGTVGAALEAACAGIPALAVSLETDPAHHFDLTDDTDFQTAAYFTQLFAAKMLKHKMPHDVDMLKIDVPADATPDTEWLLTRLSRIAYYYPTLEKPEEPGGELRYSYFPSIEEEPVEEDSDAYVTIRARKVSVTPVSIDLTSRTDFSALNALLRRDS